jgi:general stress protein YciG
MPRAVPDFRTAGDALASAVSPSLRKELYMTKQRRGFACMSPEQRREIARKGGASVDPSKRSFAKDRDLAASAGRKGGEASRGGGRKPAEAA